MDFIIIFSISILFHFNLIECNYESEPKILSLKPSNVTILSKTEALFECHVFGYPTAQITWKKNQRKINENNWKFRITNGPNYSILRVTDISHSSLLTHSITCYAENTYGEVEATSLLNIIPERDKPLQYPDISISNPKSVEPDTPFLIECNITNIHTSNLNTVLWYQSNKLISADNDKYYVDITHLKDGITRYALIVNGLPLASDIASDIQEIDFLCIASNSYATNLKQTSIQLRNRLMPPHFVLPKTSFIELFYGSSIDITCQANGMPKPKVKWIEGSFDANQLIDLTSELTNIDILRIHNLNSSMNFTCQAQNSFGLIVFNLSILAKAKPDVPIELFVRTIYYNSIEIEWKSAQINDISHYLIRYCILINEHDICSSYDIENSTINRHRILNKLKPFTYYLIQITAIDLFGNEIQSSNSIKIRTAPTKPGFVQNIRYNFKDNSFFLIRCDKPLDSNGNLISYRIYFTDQVTNSIDNWQSIVVPIEEMPYKLNLNNYKSKFTDSFYIRISAINTELGEGPYSNITQLRILKQNLDRPINFNQKELTSNKVTLQWRFNIDSLKNLPDRLNNYEYLNSNNDHTKNLYFQLYLNQTKTSYLIIKKFKINLNQYESKQQQQLESYEFILNNLNENTKYIFYLSARIYSLESELSDALIIKTQLGNNINSNSNESIKQQEQQKQHQLLLAGL